MLIRAHSNENISERGNGSETWLRLTLIEELFQLSGFPVYISPWRVVGLRVVNHEPEISFKSRPVFVEATDKLRAHGTQVHRILNDLEVTEQRFVSVFPWISDPGRTLGLYRGQDQQVGRRIWHTYAFAVSLKRFCKHLGRTLTFQRTEASARASSCPSLASGAWAGEQSFPFVVGRRVSWGLVHGVYLRGPT